MATVSERSGTEPVRGVCPDCDATVLFAVVAGELVMAEPYEWEPRAKCYVCRTIRSRGQTRARCDRCNGTGYVGERRPRERMLAIDVAWSDDGNVRMVFPSTPRRRGESLHRVHLCPSLGQSLIA